MSGGVTELLLKVATDPSGLAALAVQFEALESRIVASAARSQAALKVPSGGAADLSRMKSELDAVTASVRTLQAENEALTKKMEEGGARRTTATRNDANAHVKAYQEMQKQAEASEKEMTRLREQRGLDNAKAAVSMAEAESRATQMIISDQVKLEGERRKVVQQRIADDAKAAAAMVESENAAILQVIAGEIKLNAEMRRLKQQRIADDARAAAAVRVPGTAGGVTSAEAAAVESEVTQMKLAAEFSAKLRAEKALLAQASIASAAAAKAEAVAQQELHSAARGLAGGLGLLWTTYGAFLPLVAGFALSAGLMKAIESGKEFAYQLQFVATVGQATAEQTRGMSTEFMHLAETSAFGASEVARGARTLVQAGLSVNDSVKILPDLLRFSTLGEIELAHGAEIAAGQMHAFGLSVGDVPHILDSTAKAAQISQTNISEMGSALRQSSSIAQQYGVSIDEMNALLAVLAERNIRGTAAGTALRNMFVELDPHTVRGKRAFDALGISVYDASGKMKPIIPLMQEFAERFSKFDQQSQNRLSSDFFNERGAKAFLTAMSGARGELEKFFDEIKNSDGTLKRNADQINDTFAIQGKEAVHSFEDALIKAFQAIEPELTKMAKGFKETFQDEGVQKSLADTASGFMLIATAIGAVVEALKALGQVSGISALLGVLSDFGRKMGNVVADIRDVMQGRGGASFNNTGGFTTGGNVSRNLNLPTPDEMAAANVARYRREAAERQRAVNQSTLADFRAGETAYTNQTGTASWKMPEWAPTLKYNGDAGKQAWDQIQDENRRYREQEQAAKTHYDSLLAVLRADHDARLTDDSTFNAGENALMQKAYDEEAARLTAHIAVLKAKRGAADKDKQNDIDTEIVRAQTELMRAREQIEAKVYQDLTKEIGKYTAAGQNELDAITKKNDATESEIAALYSLDQTQQGATVRTVDATIKKLELARANLEAKAATEEFDGSLTTEAALAQRGADKLKEYIDKLKDARDQTVELAQKKKDAENDWLVGAIQGMNAYLDHGMSVAKSVEEAFKNGFTAMEGAIFNFVKTGKLSISSFLTSVMDDVLKMLIRLNITRPLAQALQGAFSGGGIAGLFGGGSDAPGGGFSLSGILGGATSIFNGVNGALGSAGSFLFGSPGVTTPGGMIDGYTSGLLGEGGFSATIGSAATSLATGLGVAGPAAAAFGEAVALAVPVIGWVVGIGGLLYTMFGSKGGGPKSGGSAYGGFDAGGTWVPSSVPGTDNGRFFTPGGSDPDMLSLVQGINKQYNSLLTAWGVTGHTATFGLGYDTDPNGTANNRISSLVTVNGQRVFGSDNRDVGRDPDALQGEMSLEVKRSLVAALKASDLPADIAAVFSGINVLTATDSELTTAIANATEIGTILSAITAFGAQLPKNLSITTLRLMSREGETLAQTFDRVGGTWAQFVSDFTTDAEKLSRAQSELTSLYSDMGIAAPTTRTEFLHIAESLDLSTESGRRFYDRMMQLAPAFITVEQAMANSISSFNAIAASLSPRFAGASARGGLESAVQEWMGLSGSNGAAGGHTVDSTIADIANLARNGNFNDARAYAMSIDPSGHALDVLTRMLQAYQGWSSTLDTGTTTTDTFSNAVATATSGLSGLSDEIHNSRQGIAGWLEGLLVNDSLSPLTPQQRLDSSHDAYVENLIAAQHNDPAALAQYTSLAEAYLKELLSFEGPGFNYQAGFTAVTSQARDLALGDARTPTAADLKAGFLSVVAAIARLEAQMGHASAASNRLADAAQQSNSVIVEAVREGALTFS